MKIPAGILYDVSILAKIYESAITIQTGKHRTTVNELTDQLPAIRPEVIGSAIACLMHYGPILGNKILSEEDKGALFVGAIGMLSRKPIAMGRWYSYPFPEELNSITVPVSMEYMQGGQLSVNGIVRGDRLSIIDDTLSTGGTAIALIEAVRQAGAEVIEMRVITEKLRFGGRERIKNATGLEVKAVLGIAIDSNGKVSVEEAFHKPISELE